jgi:hypothetical protein
MKLKSDSFNDALDDAFLGHLNVTSCLITTKLYFQEPCSIPFFFKFNFLGSQFLAKFID